MTVEYRNPRSADRLSLWSVGCGSAAACCIISGAIIILLFLADALEVLPSVLVNFVERLWRAASGRRYLDEGHLILVGGSLLGAGALLLVVGNPRLCWGWLSGAYRNEAPGEKPQPRHVLWRRRWMGVAGAVWVAAWACFALAVLSARGRLKDAFFNCTEWLLARLTGQRLHWDTFGLLLDAFAALAIIGIACWVTAMAGAYRITKREAAEAMQGL